MTNHRAIRTCRRSAGCSANAAGSFIASSRERVAKMTMSEDKPRADYSDLSITAPTDIHGASKLTFLNLPAEIRVMIYELALGPDTATLEDTYLDRLRPKLVSIKCFRERTLQSSLFTPPSSNVLVFNRYEEIPGINLLQVCRAVYHETQPLLYDRYLFRLTHPLDWGCSRPERFSKPTYLEHVGDLFPVMRRLCIDPRFSFGDDLFRTIAHHCPNLQTLQIYRQIFQSEKGRSHTDLGPASWWVNGACMDLLRGASIIAREFPQLRFAKWSDSHLIPPTRPRPWSWVSMRLIIVTMSRDPRLGVYEVSHQHCSCDRSGRNYG